MNILIIASAILLIIIYMFGIILLSVLMYYYNGIISYYQDHSMLPINPYRNIVYIIVLLYICHNIHSIFICVKMIIDLCSL